MQTGRQIKKKPRSEIDKCQGELNFTESPKSQPVLESNSQLFSQSLIEAEQQEQQKSSYWFCDYIGFEEKQNRTNRLIMNFRKWSPKPNGSITTTIYVRDPAKISSEFIFGRENLEKMIDECKSNEELKRCRMFVFLSSQLKEVRSELKAKYPDTGFIVGKSKFSVINIDVPYNTKLLDNLGYKFQKGNYNKQIRRKLDCLYKKANLDPRLDLVLTKLDQIRQKQIELRDIITDINQGDPKDRTVISRRTRFENEVNNFFSTYQGELAIEAVNSALNSNSDTIGRSKYIALKKFMEYPQFYAPYMVNLQKEIRDNFSAINSILKELHPNNEIAYNPESGEYEVTLSSREGFIFQERLTLEEIKQQVFCFVDIEKPMWKHKDEKIAIKRRQDLLKKIEIIDKILEKNKISHVAGYDFLIKLDGKPQHISELSEDQIPARSGDFLNAKSRAERLVTKLENKLVLYKEGIGPVNLWQEKYDAKIAQLVISFKLEDGSFIRQYHKLKYNAEYSPKEIDGFPVYEHNDEYALLNTVIAYARKYRPFANVAHVITYDMPQLREGTRTNKTDRLDIIVPGKEPALGYARDFYRKMAHNGQEMFDTCMMGKTTFPYLRIKAMNSSHRLADMVNYVRVLKSGSDSTAHPKKFKKIATHEELRDLEMRRINGDIEADKKMDRYTTGDLAPVEELMDFYFVYIDKISNVLKHVPLTDIMFSTSCMDEILRKRHWDECRNQYLFGYKQKEREDELQIFKKRFSSYKKRKLQSEGINTIPLEGPHKNIYMVYVPWEEWLKDAAFVRYPELKVFYNSLESNPIMRLGLLQYVKRFYSQSYFPDYYIFRRENDIEWQYKRRLGANKSGDWMDKKIEKIFLDYKTKISARNPRLLDNYYSAYGQVKNIFRSFYTSLEEMLNKEYREEIRKRLRAPGGKREEVQATFDFYNLFYEENQDLMELHKFPDNLKEKLPEKSLKLLKRFQSTFQTLNSAFKELQQIAEEEMGEIKIGEHTIQKENLVYMYNQHWRADKKKREFFGKYSISPEPEPNSNISFRAALESGYDRLAREIKEKKLIVVMQKGDYLFVKDLNEKEVDFTGTTMIPINKFENFTCEVASLNKEDEEIADLFGNDPTKEDFE